MIQQLEPKIELDFDPDLDFDVNDLVTEDDTPVDNWGSEKQQRLLTNILYSAKKWETFVAEANVGIYHTRYQPAIIPDFFLSLDVQIPENFWDKAHRCYLMWEFGKAPEIAIEIVSNTVGEELGNKKQIYQQMRVTYYVVFDPRQQLGDKQLYIFELRGRYYQEIEETYLEQVELGVTLWQGNFEEMDNLWLRWCDQEGNLLLTADEQLQQAENRANDAENRAQKLAEKLKALGYEFDDLDD
jgi:hypothetical protein